MLRQAVFTEYKTLFAALLTVALLASLPFAALAVTESEVEAQVAALGRESVMGNVFIWFLCAIAFLKISQKIDSFMSSLGVNVGNTGGSMMTELLLASRGFATAKGFVNTGELGGFGGRGSRGGSGSGGGGSPDKFLSGGLVGAIGRSLDRGAVKNATEESGGGIGGSLYASSVEKGGEFANAAIATVAHGNVTGAGMITGANAVNALNAYMGYTGAARTGTPVAGADPLGDPPVFSNVEIGGGRIMGTETTAASPDGIRFGMYDAEKYMAPESEYSTVEATDGSKWYKQYARDAVERTPYMAPDGSIAYNEGIVKKLPDMPRRKDRV